MMHPIYIYIYLSRMFGSGIGSSSSRSTIPTTFTMAQPVWSANQMGRNFNMKNAERFQPYHLESERVMTIEALDREMTGKTKQEKLSYSGTAGDGKKAHLEPKEFWNRSCVSFASLLLQPSSSRSHTSTMLRLAMHKACVIRASSRLSPSLSSRSSSTVFCQLCRISSSITDWQEL